MRIAHVVTYVSPDGASGGPTRVALGQAEALAEIGHDVTVYAAAPPRLAQTVARGGYTLRTFPARRLAPLGGFASLAAPSMLTALRSDITKFDVAHIHLARDLVTLPAAHIVRRSHVPYVLQAHGMIDASRNPLSGPLDALLTKPVLRDAVVALALTDQEALDLTGIQPLTRVGKIINGVRVTDLRSYENREDLVLFLARLASRKRPLEFVKMATQLRDRLPSTRFILAGPDEGQGEAVRRAISDADMGDRLEWIGAVPPDSTDTILSTARVYVLPAVDEVFPMSILEALRVGTPVVTTDSLGIAPKCDHYGAAIITDGTSTQLANAVERVLSDPRESARLRQGGLDFIRSELDITMVAHALESTYASMLGGRG